MLVVRSFGSHVGRQIGRDAFGQQGAGDGSAPACLDPYWYFGQLPSETPSSSTRPTPRAWWHVGDLFAHESRGQEPPFELPAGAGAHRQEPEGTVVELFGSSAHVTRACSSEVADTVLPVDRGLRLGLARSWTSRRRLVVKHHVWHHLDRGLVAFVAEGRVPTASRILRSISSRTSMARRGRLWRSRDPARAAPPRR